MMNMSGCNSVIRGRFSEAAKNVLYANVNHTPPEYSRWHSRPVSGLKLSVLVNEMAFSKREHGVIEQLLIFFMRPAHMVLQLSTVKGFI